MVNSQFSMITDYVHIFYQILEKLQMQDGHFQNLKKFMKMTIIPHHERFTTSGEDNSGSQLSQPIVRKCHDHDMGSIVEKLVDFAAVNLDKVYLCQPFGSHDYY